MTRKQGEGLNHHEGGNARVQGEQSVNIFAIDSTSYYDETKKAESHVGHMPFIDETGDWPFLFDPVCCSSITS